MDFREKSSPANLLWRFSRVQLIHQLIESTGESIGLVLTGGGEGGCPSFAGSLSCLDLAGRCVGSTQYLRMVFPGGSGHGIAGVLQ